MRTARLSGAVEGSPAGRTALAEPAVLVEGLCKRYGDTVAVGGISFSVEVGEIFGIIGRNGSGKTTTVECVQGLRRPDGGRIRVLGLDPSAQSSALRRRIGCQLQDSAVPERIRVWEALDLFAALGARSTDWHRLLDAWGLREKRNASFHSLSGGQRQRLFVALALVNDPEVVFLDEMTTGLDPAARRVAWELIDALRDRGKTVVLVTHFMEEVERLCDRVAVLDSGRVVACGTPAEIAAAHGGGTRIRFGADGRAIDWLERVPHVREIVRRGAVVEVVGDGPVLPLVAAALVEHGMAPDDMRVEQPTLEDAFMRLVGEEE